MAEVNQFQIQAQKLVNEVNSSELKLVNETLEKLTELKGLKTEKEARTFLKENWVIKDDIENFCIASGIKISAGAGMKYFNVTYEYTHDEEIDIKSFNYKLEERSQQW